VDPTDDIEHIRRERDRLLELVETIGSLSTRMLPMQMLMQEVAGSVQRLTRSVGAVVEIVDGGDMVYEVAAGTVAPYVGLRLPRGSSLSGMCVEHATLLYCRDTEHDARVNLEACRRVGARSMLVVPLMHGVHATGVLKAVSDRVDGFDAIDEHTLQLAAQFVAGLLARQATAAT
jgi:putative methionine-R-sulfoxide reductase with GAF domain